MDYKEDTPPPTLWVFGYGSLCWKPDFPYQRRLTGRVKGYSRRFWQGNTAHRGTPHQPGRVATLVEDKQGEVWGVGFEVKRDSEALEYLWEREVALGGYALLTVEFLPWPEGSSFTALAYVATPASPLWLGEAPLMDIAGQIVAATGPAGSNTEYLTRLAQFLRRHGPPEALDPHLRRLDLLVRRAVSPVGGSPFIEALSPARAHPIPL